MCLVIIILNTKKSSKKKVRQSNLKQLTIKESAKKSETLHLCILFFYLKDNN